MAPRERTSSSPVASRSRVRHTFFPDRIAAPISSAFCENSSQTSRAFSNASKASSADLPASVIAVYDAL